jgi:hypothetical protein
VDIFDDEVAGTGSIKKHAVNIGYRTVFPPPDVMGTDAVERIVKGETGLGHGIELF